jgi:hypothetical protein
MPAIAPAPYTSIARMPDGAWVMASMRGIARIESGDVGPGKQGNAAAAANEASK